MTRITINKWSYLILIFFTAISCKNQKDYDYDVCVYGGTSSGVIAAYKAAKMGKKTILIEPGKHLGGMTASGLGMTDIGDKNAISGFTVEFYKRIAKHYGEEGKTQLRFEPHVAENIFNELVAEAGFDTLLQYRIISAQKEGGKIMSIVTESSKNPVERLNKTIHAKVFIDCSYEGDLMARAGVSYTTGREGNSVYNEKHNGWQMEWNGMHQFMDGIDQYVVPGDSTSGYVYGITPGFKIAEPGTGDKNI